MIFFLLFLVRTRLACKTKSLAITDHRLLKLFNSGIILKIFSLVNIFHNRFIKNISRLK